METTPSGVVIIVDDDPYVLESVAMLLTVSGFEVRPFSNGFDALAELRQSPPDVVLTDVNMPHITGIELLERIHESDREIPVILMTAYAELEMAVSAIKKGAFDFIIKPFKPPYLIHSVEKGINYKRLTRIEKNYKRELEQTVEQRTAELNEALSKLTNMSIEIIERLTAAAELRDEDTGQHISRIGMYARLISLHLRRRSFCDEIRLDKFVLLEKIGGIDYQVFNDRQIRQRFDRYYFPIADPFNILKQK